MFFIILFSNYQRRLFPVRELHDILFHLPQMLSGNWSLVYNDACPEGLLLQIAFGEAKKEGLKIQLNDKSRLSP
jgi:hypothetical protein